MKEWFKREGRWLLALDGAVIFILLYLSTALIAIQDSPYWYLTLIAPAVYIAVDAYAYIRVRRVMKAEDSVRQSYSE